METADAAPAAARLRAAAAAQRDRLEAPSIFSFPYQARAKGEGGREVVRGRGGVAETERWRRRREGLGGVGFWEVGGIEDQKREGV